MNKNSEIHLKLETERYDKVDPQEIIDRLDRLILYFEREKRLSRLNDEKELATAPMDRN